VHIAISTVAAGSGNAFYSTHRLLTTASKNILYYFKQLDILVLLDIQDN